MKNWIYISVLITMLFSLAFGGSAVLAAPPPQEQVKVVMVGTPQGDPFYEEILPEFEEQTGIEVEYISLPREEFDAWFKARWQAEAQIDIIALDPQFFLDYYREGFMADLTDVLADPAYPSIKEDRFRAGALDFKRMDGRTYLLPVNLIMTLYYYNKDIYDEYGIEVPQTIDDVMQIKEKLEGTDIMPMAYAGKEIWWNPMFMYGLVPMLSGNDGSEFTKATIRGEVSWDDSVYVNALNILMSWWDEGVLTQDSMGFDYNGLMSAFVQGQVSTVYQGTWFYPEGVKRIAPEDFNLGVTPIPATEEGFGQPCGCTDVTLALSSKAKYPEAALQLMDFILNDENAKKLSELGYFSAIAAADPVDPNMAKVAEMYKDVPLEHLLDHLWEPEIIQAWQVQIQSMYLGEVTPEEAAAAVQKEAERLREEGKDFGDFFAAPAE